MTDAQLVNILQQSVAVTLSCISGEFHVVYGQEVGYTFETKKTQDFAQPLAPVFFNLLNPRRSCLSKTCCRALSHRHTDSEVNPKTCGAIKHGSNSATSKQSLCFLNIYWYIGWAWKVSILKNWFLTMQRISVISVWIQLESMDTFKTTKFVAKIIHVFWRHRVFWDVLKQHPVYTCMCTWGGQLVCCVFDRSAIFSLLLVTDNIVATGDDEGSLKVQHLSLVYYADLLTEPH